jgi:hypothetical protein
MTLPRRQTSAMWSGSGPTDSARSGAATLLIAAVVRSEMRVENGKRSQPTPTEPSSLQAAADVGAFSHQSPQ